jgi:hypothetical protein
MNEVILENNETVILKEDSEGPEPSAMDTFD